MDNFIGFALAAVTCSILPDSCLEPHGLTRQALAIQIVESVVEEEGER